MTAEAASGDPKRHARFHILRPVAASDGLTYQLPVAEGVQFSDGTVALRWTIGEHHSTVVWDSIESAVAIHVHDDSTAIAWLE